MDGDTVTDFAHEVKACALGQASSSIMARHIVGSKADELRELREAVRKMLKENGEPPAAGKWADIAVLEPVRDYKARHASTLLTFDAVVDAIGQIEAKRGAKTAASCRMQKSAATKIAAIAERCRDAPRLVGRGLVKLYRYTLSPLVGFRLPPSADLLRLCRPGDRALRPMGRRLDDAGAAAALSSLGHVRARLRARSAAGEVRAGTCRGATDAGAASTTAAGSAAVRARRGRRVAARCRPCAAEVTDAICASFASCCEARRTELRGLLVPLAGPRRVGLGADGAEARE